MKKLLKKWHWAMPVLVVLISMAAVIYLREREGDPYSQILETDLAGLTEKSEARVLSMLEGDPECFAAALETGALPEGAKAVSGNMLIIEQKRGLFTQYLRRGGESGEEAPGEAGYNRVEYRRAFPHGWTYCVDYTRPVLYADRYASQAGAYLTEGQKDRLLIPLEEAEILIIDKKHGALPQNRGKSAFVAEMSIPALGGDILAYFDLKTKNIIWIEDKGNAGT